MKLHLPKKLLKALIIAASAVLPLTSAAETEVWVNFGGTDKGVTDNTKTWNNILGGNAASLSGNYTLVDINGASVGNLVLSANADPWGNGDATLDVLKGYLDYQGPNQSTYWSLSFSIDDIAVTNISVNLYNSGDGGNPIAPVIVNGKSYVGDTTSENISVNLEGTASWGNAKNGALQTTLNNANTVSVTGLGSVVNITPAQTQDWNNDGSINNYDGRFTLAGLSIVWDGSTSATSITLNSGVNDASSYLQGVEEANRVYSLSGNADGTSSFNIAAGEVVQGLQSAANTVTVTSNGAISVGQLFAKAGSTLNMNAAITSGADLNIGGLGRVNLNTSQTLNTLTTTVANLGIANGATVTVNGAASLNSAVHVAENSQLNLNSSVNNSFIQNATGTGTIVLNTNGDFLIRGADNNGTGGAESVSNINTIAFGGVLSVKSGTLKLGDDGAEQKYWALDLSSLKSIDLDGGSMRLFGAASSISTINVNTASSITIHQVSVTEGSDYVQYGGENIPTNGTPGYSIGNLVLNENLTATTNWRSVMEIQKLSGDSDLIMKKSGHGIMHLHINQVDASAGMNMEFDTDMNAILGTDANAQHTIGGTITNKASLTINGAITITDNLSAFTELAKGQESGELSINGTDGYMTVTGSTYLLVDNEGAGANCTLGSMTATYGGNTIQLRQDTTTGDVTFIGGSTYDTTYRVNTFDVTAGGTNPTADTGRARSFEIAKDRTLTIAGVTDNASVSELLVNSTGEGNITLSTNVQLGENDVTKVKGKLTIGEGVQLNLGNGDLNGSNKQEASLSSFNSIVLDGGHIRVQNKKDTWKNVTVTEKGATLHINDLANSETDILTFAQTTTLNGNLTMTNDWGERIVIEKLCGTGSLIIDDDGRSDAVSLTISSTEKYSGKIHVKQTHNNLKLNVAEDAGLHVHFEGTSGKHLQLEHIAAGNSVTLQGVTGHLGNGTTIAADIEILNSSDGKKAGLELDDGFFAVNTFTGNISGAGNLVINKDNLQNHGLTFTGDVSEWTGRMDVAKGTHTITYTGDASAVKNLDILVRGGSTADIVFDHTKAATVTAPIIINGNSTLNLVVKNTAAEGTTFNGSVQATTATIKAGTVAKFTNANVQMTNLLVETGAQLSFTAKDALNVSNLSVANVGTITVANGETAGSLSASGAVTLAGGATINAAVVDLSDASSVSFDVASDAIALNGALTMRSTEAFVAALGDSLAGLTAGEMLTVFTGVSSFTVGDVTYSAESENQLAGVDLSTWSSDVAVGQYTMTYDTSANVGSIVITVGEVIPEPASATLSLAALMMLCARRRRRK